MYSNVHGVISTTIASSILFISDDPVVILGLGSNIAFLLHDPIDRLGEKAYSKDSLEWELIPFLIFAGASVLSGFWYYFIWFWIMGNLMDIIDKRFYIPLILPQLKLSSKIKSTKTYKWLAEVQVHKDFPCHTRTPNLFLSESETKLATILASLLIIIVSLIIKTNI